MTSGIRFGYRATVPTDTGGKTVDGSGNNSVHDASEMLRCLPVCQRFNTSRMWRISSSTSLASVTVRDFLAQNSRMTLTPALRGGFVGAAEDVNVDAAWQVGLLSSRDKRKKPPVQVCNNLYGFLPQIVELADRFPGRTAHCSVMPEPRGSPSC